MPIQKAAPGWLDYLKGRGGFTTALLAAVLPVCFLAFVFEALDEIRNGDLALQWALKSVAGRC